MVLLVANDDLVILTIQSYLEILFFIPACCTIKSFGNYYQTLVVLEWGQISTIMFGQYVNN